MGVGFFGGGNGSNSLSCFSSMIPSYSRVEARSWNLIFLGKKPKLRNLLFVDALRGGKSQRDEKNDYGNVLK